MTYNVFDGTLNLAQLQLGPAAEDAPLLLRSSAPSD